MDAKSTGIALTRGELRALREFGSQEPTNRDMFGVQFTVEGDRCYARATDSRRCVVFEGESDKELGDRERFVDMKFLIDCRKSLEGKQVCRLNFSGASLHQATVEENGVGRLTIERDEDAAIAQTSFPQIAKTLKLPGARREKPHCVALASGHLKAVQLAADAVEEEMVDFFPPSEPDGLMVFRVGHDKPTSCIGGILANLSAESILRPGDSDDDDDGDPDAKPRRARKGKNGKQGELPVDNDAAH